MLWTVGMEIGWVMLMIMIDLGGDRVLLMIMMVVAVVVFLGRMVRVTGQGWNTLRSREMMVMMMMGPLLLVAWW